MLWNAFNRPHNVVNGSYRTKFIKGTVETTPLKGVITCHTLCSKKLF